LKQIWIDVETTGTDTKKDSIIELAAVFIDGEIKDTFHKYCIPSNKPEDFDEVSKRSHGLTWEFLEERGIAEFELYSTFLNSFLLKYIDKFDKKDKAIFCGYNSNFDSDFIRELFSTCGNNFYGSFFVSMPYDVRTKVAECLMYDKIPMLVNYKLETVCDYFDIDFKAHSAIEDINATIKVDKKIKKLLTE